MQRIGRYEIQTLIKEGGMGAVYLARDPTIERQVAIKLIKGDLDETARRRFSREARAAGGLSHPHIVTIHDFGEHEGAPFLVMEYVQGQTLSDVIRHRMPMTLDRKLRHLAELCDGLDYAHRRGVVHRDIKPANLIIDAHQSLKILDFGVARINETTGAGTTALAGTPGYMSPEQIHGAVPDHRSDMFAAGAVCYELLSYTPAFVRDEDTPASVMMRIMNVDLIALGELCHGLPADIEQIVHTALAKEPDARFPDMAAMKAALEEAAVRARQAAKPRGAVARSGDRTAVSRASSLTPVPSNVAAQSRLATPPPPVVVRQPPEVAPQSIEAIVRGPARVQPPWSPRIVAIVAAAVAVVAIGGWWIVRSMSEPGGSGAAAVDVTVADTAPSFDSAAPSPLALGQVVRGRLPRSSDSGRYHYWLIDVPPGSYKLVVDARRSDDAESNLGANLDWVPLDGAPGSRLGMINAVAFRTRAIFRFSTEQPRRASIKYDNFFDISDYWLGLFKADDKVPAPFFANPPTIEPLALGKPSAEVLLETANASRRYAFSSLPLAAGDYKVTVTFARPDFAESNVGGSVEVLGSEGQELHRSLIIVNKIGSSASGSGKLSLAEDEVVYFKRHTYWDQRSTILVEKWEEP